MGLKQIINRKKILGKEKSGVEVELTLPGEPLVYSIKYPVGSRHRPREFFRNRQWTSALKCYFISYYVTNTPVVVLVRFYVSPPSHVKVKAADLKKEKTPAIFAYELCDYLLSFLEILHHVLINSYRQIVKVEAEKFYSAKPRTVFQFMKWEHYVNIQNNNSIQSKA